MTLPWSSEFREDGKPWRSERMVNGKKWVRDGERGQTGNVGAAVHPFVVFPKARNVNISEMNVCHSAVITALP